MLASKSIVVNGGGTGNRTLISRLKAGDNAIILYLRLKFAFVECVTLANLNSNQDSHLTFPTHLLLVKPGPFPTCYGSIHFSPRRLTVTLLFDIELFDKWTILSDLLRQHSLFTEASGRRPAV